MMDDAQLTVSVADVCHKWGLSRPTVYKLLADPESPAFKIGKRWVIPEELFDEWMFSKADDKVDAYIKIKGDIDAG